MDTAHKNHKEEKKPAATSNEVKTNAADIKENDVVSGIVTETTEIIEVIETDPLTKFKEKMNEEENPVPNMPAPKNFMWPILFVFIIALVMLGGIFIYKQGMNKTEKINVVSLSPTPMPSPTPIPVIDLSKYSIEILNGSEAAGEAGRQKESLDGEGFTVSSVGNADESTYTETIIQVKKEVDSAFLDKLKSILENTFILGETETLSEDAATPVIIILGTKK